MQLAEKLLHSITLNEHVQDIRLGLNGVSRATELFVKAWAYEQMLNQPVYLYQPTDNANIGKYPLMRQMFKDRVLANKIMWFDDDSYVDPVAGSTWWDSALAVSNKQVQIGSVHFIMQRGRQHEVIIKQPWYKGQLVNSRHRFKFITGGWWIADSAFIAKWDYPFKELYHNGGDSILGELLRQQGIQPGTFPNGVQCHCEACKGKGVVLNRPVVHINVGGRKGRRGLGVSDEKYIWSDGNSSPSLSHQNFDLRVIRYEL